MFLSFSLKLLFIYLFSASYLLLISKCGSQFIAYLRNISNLNPQSNLHQMNIILVSHVGVLLSQRSQGSQSMCMGHENVKFLNFNENLSTAFLYELSVDLSTNPLYDILISITVLNKMK